MRFSIPVISSVAFLAFQCCFPTSATAQTLDTPTITSSDIAGCNGSYILTWTAISGASGYQVWAQFPGDSGYHVAKLPTSTDSLVHAQNSPGLTNFEVRACDASGNCGGFSSPIALSWYSGCP